MAKKNKKKIVFTKKDLSGLRIIIRCNNKKEMMKVEGCLHHQLTGNSDYIDNRIILNNSKVMKAANPKNKGGIYGLGYNVYVWAFDGAVIPPLSVGVAKKSKKKGAKK